MISLKHLSRAALRPVFFCVHAVSAVLFEEELKRVGLVILSLRRIWSAVLRFFAKEARNDRVCGFVILNGVKDLALFTIKILRKRGSE